MIKEAYCSFEVSKLLKEKGFNERSSASYDLKGQLQEGYGYWNKTPIWYAAPTHQMAMAWLREVHNLNIGIVRGPSGYHIIIETIPFGVVKYITTEIVGTPYVDSYEEAVEVALKYCLEKLI